MGGTGYSLPLPTSEVQDINIKSKFKFLNITISLPFISKILETILGVSQPLSIRYIPKPALIKATPLWYLSGPRGIKFGWIDTHKSHLKGAEVNSIGTVLIDNTLKILNLAYNKLSLRWKILLQSSKRDYLAVKIINAASENLSKNSDRPGSNPPSNSQTTL